jgi:hypothetical protein
MRSGHSPRVARRDAMRDGPSRFPPDLMLREYFFLAIELILVLRD